MQLEVPGRDQVLSLGVADHGQVRVLHTHAVARNTTQFLTGRVVGCRGGEKLWEMARDPLFKRIKHTAIDSLPRLIDEFAQLQRFVYIDAEGRIATLAKQELTLKLLATHLGTMDDDDDDDDASEEVNLSVSITAELEDLQRPFNLPLPQ